MEEPGRVACAWVWEGVWARRGVGLGMARAGIGILGGGFAEGDKMG